MGKPERPLSEDLGTDGEDNIKMNPSKAGL
jgi:hypothetical protein